MIKDVKITVYRRLSSEDLIREHGVGVAPQCDALKDGQEFVSHDVIMPDGFCAWAWADIQRDVAVLGFGGNFPWVREEGIMFSCCTDAFRPVIFKLERLD